MVGLRRRGHDEDYICAERSLCRGLRQSTPDPWRYASYWDDSDEELMRLDSWLAHGWEGDSYAEYEVGIPKRA
jgi:hypothetical protein